MATNKHAVIRYQALDKCFSNFGRRFYIDDLIEACNNAIYDFTGKTDGIKRRQLFEDIKFMESDAGYSIELDRIDDGKKKYYRYTNKDFSINKQPLSQTEAKQLKDTILMLNRFKGLPQFDWMQEVLTRLEDTFKLKDICDYYKEFPVKESVIRKFLFKFMDPFFYHLNISVPRIFKVSFNEMKNTERQIAEYINNEDFDIVFSAQDNNYFGFSPIFLKSVKKSFITFTVIL